MSDPWPEGFCDTREKLELLTDLRDFTTLFIVILRRKSFEWYENYLGTQFSIRSLNFAFHDFDVLKHSF